MDTELSETQLAFARAILLVERHLEPRCEGCGYGADRPNCAMDLGGGCRRHEQRDVIAYGLVVDELTRLGGLSGEAVRGWRNNVPLHLLHDFNEVERDLLFDLHDRGGKQSTRRNDDRFNRLGCGSGGKGAVLQSTQGGRWHVQMTSRGAELVERWLAETAAPEEAKGE